MDLQTLLKMFEKTGIPQQFSEKGAYAIYGSGPMAFHGLKDSNDLDILVNSEVWQYLIDQGHKPQGNRILPLEDDTVEIFKTWTNDIDPVAVLRNAEKVHGYWVASLDDVLNWKRKRGKPKDLIDAKTIEEYLAKNKSADIVQHLYAIADNVPEVFLEREAGIGDLWGKAKQWASKLKLPLSAVKDVLSMRPTEQQLADAARELEDLMKNSKKAARPVRRQDFFVYTPRDPVTIKRDVEKLRQQQREKAPSQRWDRPTRPGAPIGPSRGAPIGPGREEPAGPSRGAPTRPGAPIGPSRGAPIGPGREEPVGPSRGAPTGPGRKAPDSPDTSPGLSKLPPSSGDVKRPSRWKWRIKILILFLLMFGGKQYQPIAEKALNQMPVIEQQMEQGEATPIARKISIYFDFDKSDIRSSEEKKVDEIIKMISENPNCTVNLDGHASAPGTNIYNDKLSKDRAETLAKRIREKVPGCKINVRHHGEDQARGRDSDTRETDRQEDRRVDVEILPGQAKTAHERRRAYRVVAAFLKENQCTKNDFDQELVSNFVEAMENDPLKSLRSLSDHIRHIAATLDTSRRY